MAPGENDFDTLDLETKLRILKSNSLCTIVLLFTPMYLLYLFFLLLLLF